MPKINSHHKEFRLAIWRLIFGGFGGESDAPPCGGSLILAPKTGTGAYFRPSENIPIILTEIL